MLFEIKYLALFIFKVGLGTNMVFLLIGLSSRLKKNPNSMKWRRNSPHTKLLMHEENQPLVTYKPIEFEEQPVEV